VNCLSKRGKTFQYIHMVPNLPDASAGIYTEPETPDDAMQKHLHEICLIGLGEGKGRADLKTEADVIVRADAILRAADTPKQGEEWSPLAGIDWQGLLMMPPLTAAEIATNLGEPVQHVVRTLRYFRQSRDYGFIKDADAVFGESAYRYKMPDVLPHLQKWYAKRQKKRQKKSAKKSKPPES
jgi:hypothetical protein